MSNDLTAEDAESTEEQKREMNNFHANGFSIMNFTTYLFTENLRSLKKC
jgi:hypothetical protein